jgi:hypothetical protein
VGTAQPRAPRRPPPPRPSAAQCVWIEHRDRIGEVIDGYLRTRPAPEMRVAVEQLEAVLADADHAVGLL